MESNTKFTLGAPRLLLRLEAALMLVAATIAYRTFGGTWGTFAALFLLPDLGMLGYLAGAKIGSITYNAMHAYVGPALLAAFGFFMASHDAQLGACIWAAHVGFDRMLGYGLKYGSAFGDTHLGQLHYANIAPRAAV